MNEMTRFNPKFPVVKQWQLEKQRSQMEYITRLSIEALGEQSTVYSYTVFEVLRTLETVMRLKAVFSPNTIPPETEALLQNLTSNYLRAMEQIPNEACSKILIALQNASPQPDDGGVLKFLTNAFLNRLYGQ